MKIITILFNACSARAESAVNNRLFKNHLKNLLIKMINLKNYKMVLIKNLLSSILNILLIKKLILFLRKFKIFRLIFDLLRNKIFVLILKLFLS